MRIFQSALHPLADFLRLQVHGQVTHLAGGRLAVSGCLDRGRSATRSVSAGVNSFQVRGLRGGFGSLGGPISPISPIRAGRADTATLTGSLFPDLNSAPLLHCQVRLRIANNRVGTVSERHNHQVSVHFQDFPGRLGTAPPGLVRLPQLHHPHAGSRDMVVFVLVKLGGRAQLSHDNALFQGVMQFLHAGRHLGLGAPVHDGDVTAQAPGGACRVHRRVSSANDQDFFAGDFGQGRVIVGQVAVHQIHASQELVGAHDPVEMLAGHVHELRQPRARTDENAPKTGRFQVV